MTESVDGERNLDPNLAEGPARFDRPASTLQKAEVMQGREQAFPGDDRKSQAAWERAPIRRSLFARHADDLTLTSASIRIGESSLTFS